MEFRKGINLFLAVFGIVLSISFSYAGYLIYKQRSPSRFSQEETFNSSHQNQNLAELLATAESQLKNSQVEQALIAFRKALSLNPASLEAQLGLAQGEFLAGREEVSAREYERAISLDSKNPKALLQLAHMYSHQKKTWGQSELKFREYLKVKPDDLEAQLGLARVLAWQGKAAEATEVFSRQAVARLMTQQDSRDYAFALVKSGQRDQAEPLLKKLLSERPHDWELKLQLASIYAERKDWDSALPIYSSVLQERPNDPRVNLTYGLGLLSQKNYKAALVPLEKARIGMPSNGEAGLGYARALKGVGNLRKAAKEFDRVVPEYQNNPGILREYADLLLEKRDYSKSEKYYKAAYKSGVCDERLLTGLGGALRGNGKSKEALPFMEEAYRRQPTDRLAFELAKLYQKLGRNDKALELLSKISPQRAAK